MRFILLNQSCSTEAARIKGLACLTKAWINRVSYIFLFESIFLFSSFYIDGIVNLMMSFSEVTMQ